MTRKEQILAVLQGRRLTEKEISAEVGAVAYSQLMDLLKEGAVQKDGARPAKFSLCETYVQPQDTQREQETTAMGAESACLESEITNENLDAVDAIIASHPAYGPENELLCRCLRRFKFNTDPDIVAMKIGLIDITNSTHLSQHKSKINMAEFAYNIMRIPNLDARISRGDPTVVNEIANQNGIKLFSFASKFCCYHNRIVYGRDDYSILDTVLKDHLPKYFNNDNSILLKSGKRKAVTTAQIKRWQDNLEYEEYNAYIKRNLDRRKITTDQPRKKLDHFIWYRNRDKQGNED